MSTIIDFGIDQTNTGLYQPKARNKWKAIFTNLGGPRDDRTGMVSTLSNATAVSPNMNAITMQCTNFSRPKLDFEEVALHRYNSVGYSAGKYSWSETSLTLEDDVTSYASRLLQQQIQRQQDLLGRNVTGLQYSLMNTATSASQYKFGCQLSMLDGGDGELETWYLQGCWFKSINWGDLDYSDGGIVKIECSIRFDHAVQAFTNREYGTALGGFGTPFYTSEASLGVTTTAQADAQNIADLGTTSNGTSNA
jgi:hypothetical protein